MSMNTKLKKNDLVKVLTGKDKGKSGRILEIDSDKGRVLVEGLNMKKKTVRPRNQQEKGGIIEVEGFLHISNVMVIGKDGKETRLGFKFEGDKKIRIAKSTGEAI
jgi:large subunit ribosomal protein L24